jgi:hypothetical protein
MMIIRRIIQLAYSPLPPAGSRHSCYTVGARERGRLLWLAPPESAAHWSLDHNSARGMTMAIDYTALLGISAGIQVAKADYDFTRDGGALYNRPINSNVVPSGSIVLGYAIYTSLGLTFATAGTLSFTLNGITLAVALPTLGNMVAAWFTGIAAFVTTADRAIEGYVSGDAVTAGAATIWLFYLPT